jgi:hypothetical protein
MTRSRSPDILPLALKLDSRTTEALVAASVTNVAFVT